MASHMPSMFPSTAKSAGVLGGGVDHSVPQMHQKDVVWGEVGPCQACVGTPDLARWRRSQPKAAAS